MNAVGGPTASHRLATVVGISALPSSCAEAKLGCEMLDLEGSEHFGEHVGNHIFGWAIHKLNAAILDDPVDEVKANIDVLGASMVTVV